MTVLITGGAGYLGSHACIELLNLKFNILILDNFSNSTKENIFKIEKITGRSVEYIEGDVRDRDLLERIFKSYQCKSVIHFAGLKSVNDSIKKPLEYYDNNVYGTQQLLRSMQNNNVKILIFSSSAAVYGKPKSLPIKESHILSPENSYGRTKMIVETMLNDLFQSEPGWKIAILRYFNPIGAHESGMIGEQSKNVPDNLVPYIGQVITGQQSELKIYGNDYPTPDGTGIRDYVHVTDLILGHIQALNRLNNQNNSEIFTLNFGTGMGYSVLEILKLFEKETQRSIPYRIEKRRKGDVAICYADPMLANQLLNWKATRQIETMCVDHLRWETQRWSSPKN